MLQSETPPKRDRRVFLRLGDSFPGALLLAALSLLAPISSSLAETAPTSSLHTSILALDSARRTVLQDLAATPLSTTEAADYTDFIAYLNTQIVNYCLAVAEQEGPAALADLPCQIVTGGSPAATAPTDTTGSAPSLPPLSPTTAQAQSEQTAAIEAELFAALAEFDDMLLKEEEKIAARVPSQRESGLAGRSGGNGNSAASPAGSGQSAGDPEGAAATSGASPGQETPAGERSAGRQDAAGAGKGSPGSQASQTKHGAPGGTRPPPEDDDIVARQLREAAEKEPDPELREKLWEEYWKYKGVKKGD